MILLLFFHSELIDCFLAIMPMWFEYYRWEIRMVGGVGEVLSLKTYSTATWESGSMLSFVSIGPVVCINLYTRLCCINFHSTSAYGLFNSCRKAQFPFFFLVENKAMIISCTVSDLFVICIDVLSFIQ